MRNDNSATSRLELFRQAAIDSEIGNLAKGSFIASLSHELRIPLNSILGMLRLLKDTDLDPLQSGYVKSALEAGECLNGWIGEITRFSSVELDEFKIDEKPFDLFRACRDVIKVFAGEASSKGVNLQYEFKAGTPGLLNGDVLKLQQVLAKLVENGLRFTQKGSVSLVVDTGGKKDDRVLLSFTVADTGSGISPEDQERIFDFSDEQIAEKPRARKIRLELAVCKKIIDSMGGTIELKSGKGEGTEFTVVVPLAETPEDVLEAIADAKVKVAESPVKKPKKYSGIKVLVAEDDTINQSLAVAFLTRLGGEVQTADNGREAVEMFQSGTYNLVFMDCEMPEMDGYEATREIRKLEEGTGKH
ncbi:MAG: response regulator, partial [Victivallales bacterium]|nr:response regulator [Victivallales bacterium]